MLSKTNRARAFMSLAVSFLFLFCLICPAHAKEGTDGTELQVAQPEQLMIQLGPEWAGVEFQLKTDSGLYPGAIPVGDDGILKLEIGGSESYTLTCIGSSVSVPVPAKSGEVKAESVVLVSEPAEGQSDMVMESHSHEPEPELESEPALAGIPIWQLCLFGGGMVIAIGALIVMAVMKRRRGAETDEEDDEYE